MVLNFVATMINIFFNGFSWRKRNYMLVLITVAIAQVLFIFDIMATGLPNFETIAMRTSGYDVIVAVIVVVGVWALGYIAGGISLKKKVKMDDYPGKIIENVGFDIDNK